MFLINLLASFPNHFSLTSEKNVKGSRKGVKESWWGVRNRHLNAFTELRSDATGVGVQNSSRAEPEEAFMDLLPDELLTLCKDNSQNVSAEFPAQPETPVTPVTPVTFVTSETRDRQQPDIVFQIQWVPWGSFLELFINDLPVVVCSRAAFRCCWKKHVSTYVCVQ